MKTLHQTIGTRNFHHQLHAGTQNNLPLLVLYSTWAGISEFEESVARRLNVQGYDVLLVDLFSQDVPLETVDQRRAAMGELMADMSQLQQRLLQFEHFIEAEVGAEYSGIITSGYCFGGLCSLMSAFLFKRVSASASFHALLKVPSDLTPQNPDVRLLIMNGHKDPMVTAQERMATEAHFDRLGLDWTLINYGRAMHSFALPHVNAPANGTCHDALTDRRSCQVFIDFIQEA